VLTIGDCAADDVDAFEALMPTGGHDAHARHFTAAARGEIAYLVARLDGEPSGSAVIGWAGCADPDDRAALPDVVEISNLHVRPDLRGRGIGSALIAAAEQRAREHGWRRAALGVEVGNVDAARLYARLGYVDTGRRSVARYRYRDADGVTHDVVEHNMLLVKAL
jgi:ribosomal protein S18 acetylase RimI-like enzyme